MRIDTRLTSDAPRSVVLVRLAVGAIFLSEGIQKLTVQLPEQRQTSIRQPSE